MILTNSRYALVGYLITSYPTRAHRIIVMYLLGILFVCVRWFSCINSQLQTALSNLPKLITFFHLITCLLNMVLGNRMLITQGHRSLYSVICISQDVNISCACLPTSKLVLWPRKKLEECYCYNILHKKLTKEQLSHPPCYSLCSSTTRHLQKTKEQMNISQ